MYFSRSGGWNHSTCLFFFQEHRHRHLRERWKEFFGQVKLQARNTEDSDQTGRCPAICVGIIHLFREKPWQYGDNDCTSRIFKMMTLLKKTPSQKTSCPLWSQCFHYFTMFFFLAVCWPMGFLRWSLLFFGAKPKKQKLVSWFEHRGGCSYIYVYPVFLHVYIWCIASKGWTIWF